MKNKALFYRSGPIHVMILTNALLSIGFSIVSNFTNVVPVPADAVPTSVEDLREFVILCPPYVLVPLQLSLVHRRGTAL